jgi:hypothetical protein
MKSKMRTLTVVRPHKYGTRHLTAGEEYEVPVRHALALVAGKKARFAEDKPRARAKAAPVKVEEKAQAQAATTVQTTELDPLDDFRAQAARLGIEVDGRWGRARLQYEIEKAGREPR